MLELHCLQIFAQGRRSQWDAGDQGVSKEKGLKCARTNSKVLCAHARAGSALCASWGTLWKLLSSVFSKVAQFMQGQPSPTLFFFFSSFYFSFF